MARPKNSRSTVMLSRKQLEDLVGKGGLVCVPKKWLKHLGFDVDQQKYATGLGYHPDGKEIWSYRDWDLYKQDRVANYNEHVAKIRSYDSSCNDLRRRAIEEGLNPEDNVFLDRIEMIRRTKAKELKVLKGLRDELRQLGLYDSSMWPDIAST